MPSLKGGDVIAAALSLLLASCGASGLLRDQIKIVGSSTVYPFSTRVAEAFVNTRPVMKAPVIESTGTGAGMKLFCAGVGPQHPDIVNASRRMKRAEYAICQRNGGGEVIEVPIGTDGIALAGSDRGPHLRLTRRDLYLALAATPFGQPNRSRTWRDVNSAPPALPIQIYGPPSTSGTRDALAELILAPGCKAADPGVEAIEARDPEAFADRCTRVRDDGVYVDKGENDNLIVQNLSANPNAIGVFGYSYLEENADRLRGTPLEGVVPSAITIADGRYPGARALYLYVKKRHLRAVPGLKEYLADFAAAWHPAGPLAKRGLIPGRPAARAAAAAIVAKQTALDPRALA